MDRSDIEINREIRKVFVKHWIDLGQLFIRTSGGKASVRGLLQRIEGFKEELTSSIVDGMYTELRRIGGVARLTVDFENWVNAGGSWKCIGAEKAKQHLITDAQAHPAVFDADKPSPT